MFNIRSLKIVFLIGAIASFVCVFITSFDIVFGSITSSNIESLPQTAIERFYEFKDNWFIGLYHLDFINIINSMIMLFVYVAICIAHKNRNFIYFGISFLVAFFGTLIFVSNNTALGMLELSNKYFNTTLATQKDYYIAAGEALLINGIHGSLGVFLGFLISSIGSLLISILILKGKIFGKFTSWFGIIGNGCLLIYVVLIALIPQLESIAVLIAAPGGILALIWIVLTGLKLYKLSRMGNFEVIS